MWTPDVRRSASHGAVRGLWRAAAGLGVPLALAALPPLASAQAIPSERTVLAALRGTLAELDGTLAEGEGTLAAPGHTLPAREGTLAGGSAATPWVFTPDEPGRLRPCCAFGGEMRVKLLGMALPCYRHKPVRGPDQIGPHEYDPGLLQILPSPVRTQGPGPRREHNGIVYTCRGGFLDTAHVRDFADLTWFLAARVEPVLESGGTIDLVEYGGTRRVTIRPVARQAIERAGRTRLAIAVAGRLSFDLSVWREIATWYGYESVPPWPEKLSSFSPEDLYSNLIGTKIAEGILQTQRIASQRDWDLAMTAWLGAVLHALVVVPAGEARERMESVDGVLWSSSRSIPDWRVTVRRRFARGPVVEPRVVPESPGTHAASPCGASDAPVPLPVKESLGGVSIDDVGVIDVAASDWLVRHGLPLPRPPSRHIMESDFEGLIEAVRRETEAGLREDAEPAQAARLR